MLREWHSTTSRTRSRAAGRIGRRVSGRIRCPRWWNESRSWISLVVVVRRAMIVGGRHVDRNRDGFPGRSAGGQPDFASWDTARIRPSTATTSAGSPHATWSTSMCPPLISQFLLTVYKILLMFYLLIPIINVVNRFYHYQLKLMCLMLAALVLQVVSPCAGGESSVGL